MKLVTVAEMRALEAAAVEAGISERQLMEEAGLAVAQEAWMQLGTLEGRRICILAGPGNNGGDGIVAARHLFDWGAGVAIYIPRRRRDPALVDDLAPREIVVLAGEEDPGRSRLQEALSGADLVIDALMGIGQARPLDPSEPLAEALAHLRATRAGYAPPKLLAVDLPTGVNADTGEVDPLTVPADLTVTFGLPKIGMYQDAAAEVIGRVQVIDIGIPKSAQEAVKLELLTSRSAKGWLPPRPASGNKGTFGKVLVVGGSRRYVSAPRLAAAAAYRAGAGLVTIACPAECVAAVAPALAEATWLPQGSSASGGLPGESALSLRPQWRGFEAAVIGPGMGNDDDTRALVWAILPDLAAEALAGCVLDADALNALATMADAPGRVPTNAILTPHPGEMARLLGTSVPEVQRDRMGSARRAAERYGCVVVLKGANTVVAAADGRVALSPFANALLATAGSGDVLAGGIAGYLAQGVEPFIAAALGVYVHGACGEALREEYGDAGLLASELADRWPKVVAGMKK
jgi:NAD(P)H-hydrate epimerase